MCAKSIAVIGGGVVGLSAAFALQQQGCDIVVIDPREASCPPSLGNAGHIAVEQIEPLSSLRTIMQAPLRHFALGGALDFPSNAIGSWAPFAARFISASSPKRFACGKSALAACLKEAMPAWRRLTAEINASDLLLEEGHFVVWKDHRQAADGEKKWAQVNADTAQFRPASSEELDAVRQRVSAPVAAGIRFDHSGQIADLAALRDKLIAAIASGGGRFIRDRAAGLRLDGRTAKAKLLDRDCPDVDGIVVASGVEAGALMRMVGHRAPIIAERGYHIEAPTQDWPPFPPVVFEDHSLIATRFEKTLRLAGFVEFSTHNAPPDQAKWRRLMQYARKLGVRFSEEPTRWMGARPTFPDYLPAIGRSDRADTLYYAFGHQHLGLTLAPATGEAIAALVQGETPLFDVAPFALSRFDAHDRRPA